MASGDTQNNHMRSVEPPVRYGFYDRLTAEFPSQVIMDTTEFCNLACIHCPHPAFKKSKYYSGAAMNPELNAKAVDEVREQGRGRTQYMRYTGSGETMIHPQFFEMLEYATSRSGTVVTVTTNGVSMKTSRIERLLASGVDIVDISIDAYSPETYAKIRVGGDLEVTRANVLKLIEMSKQRGARTKVVVSYIEQPQNAHETRDFEKYWTEHGAQHVVVRRLHSAAGAVVATAAIMRKEIASTPRRPCLYPWERVVVTARGYLSFCPADWTHGASFIDYRTTTIAETWRSEFYERLREAHLKNDFSKHGFCGQCPDWKATRWPGQGLSYADMVEKFKESE
jgi:MoaA/NifB/PqqE/SkfB family radical SAM enzyme